MASSSSSSAYTPPAISRFFIFNPKFGPREDNDHEKILFYHPEATTLDAKMKDVGLGEALTNVTKTFSNGVPCEVMHTKKMRWIFHNPEPGYWMVMVLTNSFIQRPGQPIEYLDNELNDVALGKLLESTYEHHRLFNGTFEHTYTVEDKKVEVLRAIVRRSFSQTLTTLTAQQASVFGALGGMTFLPTSPGSFMKLHSLVSVVSMNIPEVSHILLMYRDLLVWSDLDQDNTRILYTWWSEFLARKSKVPAEPKFWYGIHDPAKPDSPINTPTVYLKDLFLSSETSGDGFNNFAPSSSAAPPSDANAAEPNFTPRGFVVLQGYGAACLFLIKPEAIEDRSFYRTLFDLVSPTLRESSTIMAKSLESQENEEFMYIYFNAMNLALKSTIKSRSLEIPRDTMSTLLDMHEYFQRSGTALGEIIVKTASDSWIIGKKAESRLLFVLIDQRHKTILDIADDVQALCSRAFKGVFVDAN